MARAALACQARRRDQGGVRGVAHVGAFDEDLGDGRQVDSAQVVTRLDPIHPVVGADRLMSPGGERRPQIGAEDGRRTDDGVVDPVSHRFEDGEPAPAGRTAVGVDGHPRVGVSVVTDGGPLRDAGTHAGVRRPGQHDRGALTAQIGGQVARHVPVELRLGVTAVGLGSGRVAGLAFPAVPDQPVDDRGRAGVSPVVSGIHQNDLAVEDPARSRRKSSRAAVAGPGHPRGPGASPGGGLWRAARRGPGRRR